MKDNRHVWLALCAALVALLAGTRPDWQPIIDRWITRDLYYGDGSQTKAVREYLMKIQGDSILFVEDLNAKSYELDRQLARTEIDYLRLQLSKLTGDLVLEQKRRIYRQHFGEEFDGEKKANTAN